MYNGAMDEISLRKALEPLALGGLRLFKSLGSTNDEAIAWAEAGCPDFSLVTADEQTQGRGRFDRKWVSRAGAALAFSLILLPSPREKELLPLFAPLCGVAIQEVLHNQYGLNTEIKWPNDILLHRKKCAGILVESIWTGEMLRAIILGVGINVRAESVPPLSDQMFPATALESETGRSIDRDELLAALLHSIRAWRSELGSRQFFQTWQSHLAFIGEEVAIVQSPKSSIIGVVQGIDRQGRLILKQAGNQEVKVDVGDVHLRSTGGTVEKENDHAG